MTTVQVPKAFVQRLPRHQSHRRQPFYEILDAALRLLEGRVPDPTIAGGDEPP